MVNEMLWLACLFAVSQASPLLIKTNLIPEVGASTQYKTQDNHGNYAFVYSEDHTSGGTFRKEHGDSHGNKIGSYGLHEADGRARVVNYVADSHGFRADVHTNEPGVDPTQDPANVSVNKALVVASPAATLVAPTVAHAATLVAPTVAHAVTVVAPAVIPKVTVTTHHSAVSFLHPMLLHSPFYFGHGHHIVL